MKLVWWLGWDGERGDSRVAEGNSLLWVLETNILRWWSSEYHVEYQWCHWLHSADLTLIIWIVAETEGGQHKFHVLVRRNCGSAKAKLASFAGSRSEEIVGWGERDVRNRIPFKEGTIIALNSNTGHRLQWGWPFTSSRDMILDAYSCDSISVARRMQICIWMPPPFM